MECKPQESKLITCIKIFPEELWEMILDTMVEESKDIQSVLAALPELSNLLHGRKPNWYIDQAFPHIFKQLFRYHYPEPFLALRRISKRWCNVTEEFLKNDPSYHPYNHNGINRRNISYGQFNYIQVYTLCPKLLGTEMIQRRYEEMLDHPRNPFIIGRICISNQIGIEIPHEPYLEASLVFLKKYGHHVSHFDFTVKLTKNQQFEIDDAELLFGKIFECISYTANVRFLKMDLRFSNNRNLYKIADDLLTPDFSDEIPELPYLETLILEYESGNSNGKLTNAFSVASWITRLKRLEIPLVTDMFSFSRTFPYLSELCLDITGDFPLECDELEFLNKENFPLLKKLSFISMEETDVCINELFSLLGRLEIEEMQLLVACVIANDQNCNLTPIPSITYFRVGDIDHHNFEFLKMLTSLEYLYLENYLWKEPTEHEMGMEINRNYCIEDRDFSSQLRMYMNEPVVPKDVNIWEALPTLKFIGVEMDNTVWKYSRECGNTPFRNKKYL